MQKAIAKYGLAAHLALLSVAPLLLFPFCTAPDIATVVLWFSLVGAWWIVLEPSLRGGEMLHDARRRVWRSIARDPLFWVLVVFAALAGIRALKTMAQTAAAIIGTCSVLSSVDWRMVLSSAALSGLLSLLTSIAGIPEVCETEASEN